MSIIFRCKNPRFLSVQDEVSFLNWAKRIKSIKLYFVNVKELLIEIKDKTTRSSLKELLALFKRYKLGKTQIIKIEKMLKI